MSTTILEPAAPSCSDAQLISACRNGDIDAFGELFERHRGAVQSVALRHVNNSSDAEDLTSEAFTKILYAFQRGQGPESFFRAYACTTVSRLAYAQNDRSSKDQLTGEPELFESPDDRYADPVMAAFESGTVAKAFNALPERWQAVLWYSEIDNMQPAAIAPLLGLSPNGVSALLLRAKEGLRNAYLQSHVLRNEDELCAPFAQMLGSYVRGALGARNRTKVGDHLKECERCASLVLQLEDVGSSMRAIVFPLVVGAIASGVPAAALAGAGLGGGAGVAAAFSAPASSAVTAPLSLVSSTGLSSQGLSSGLGSLKVLSAVAVKPSSLVAASVVAVTVAAGGMYVLRPTPALGEGVQATMPLGTQSEQATAPSVEKSSVPRAAIAAENPEQPKVQTQQNPVEAVVKVDQLAQPKPVARAVSKTSAPRVQAPKSAPATPSAHASVKKTTAPKRAVVRAGTQKKSSTQKSLTSQRKTVRANTPVWDHKYSKKRSSQNRYKRCRAMVYGGSYYLSPGCYHR